MDTAVGVIAHHTRAHHALQLAETIDAEYMSVDDGTLGVPANHRKVWQWLADNHTGAQFCVALEDDAQPVAGFRNQLHQALTASPTPIVSLYLGRGRPPHWQTRIKEAITNADQTGAHWLITDGLLHGVGIAIRTSLVYQMLDTTQHSSRPIDYAIRDWANAHQHRIGFCWPSLVNHRDQPTLIAHPDGEPRTQPRTAWRTGTRHEWTDKKVNL